MRFLQTDCRLTTGPQAALSIREGYWLESIRNLPSAENLLKRTIAAEQKMG